MKQGEMNVLLIAKYPVKVHFNAKVMMYEFVLVTLPITNSSSSDMDLVERKSILIINM
jgi:hypothetical protein